jgi:hypothetical protein
LEDGLMSLVGAGMKAALPLAALNFRRYSMASGKVSYSGWKNLLATFLNWLTAKLTLFMRACLATSGCRQT